MLKLDPGAKGEKIDALLERLKQLAGLGITEAHGQVPGMSEIEPLKLMGREVVPAAAEL
jgi:alkanesulfonate monooxygenase